LSQTKANTVPPTPGGTSKFIPGRTVNRIRGTPDFGNGNNWDFEQQIRAIGVEYDPANGLVAAQPALITSSQFLATGAGGNGKILSAIVMQAAAADAVTGGVGALATAQFPYAFNGSNNDRQRGNDGVINTVSAASPATLIAAPGAGLKTRIMRMVIGSSAAGVVVVGDGATIANVQVPAGGSVALDFSPVGILQPTAAAAVTLTLAAATLTGWALTAGTK
jgi:hypothetical protein